MSSLSVRRGTRGLLAAVLLVLLGFGMIVLGPRLAQFGSWGGVESGPVVLGIPTPIVDGGFRYYGDGRFLTDGGREFFWRNGRFENPDGTLMEVPVSVNDKLRARGIPTIEQQPTADD